MIYRYWCIFNHFYICARKATEFGEITQRLGLLRRSRSFKVTEFGTNRKLICDLLLVINSNLPPILHRFRDIAFDRSKIAIFGYPVASNPPRRRGFPGTISVKFYLDVSGITVVPNGLETLVKISTGWVGRTNDTDRQTIQTDAFTTTYSERERLLIKYNKI